MFARTVAEALGRRNVHYAWVIAAVTFFAMLTTSAALGLPGAMLKPLSSEFGWTTEQLSSVFAVRFALFGLLGPFAAVFISRYGLRRVMLAAAAFIATAALSREIERKTVLTVVSKPVPRPAVVIGKYLGASGALLTATVPMVIFLHIALRHGSR